MTFVDDLIGVFDGLPVKLGSIRARNKTLAPSGSPRSPAHEPRRAPAADGTCMAMTEAASYRCFTLVNRRRCTDVRPWPTNIYQHPATVTRRTLSTWIHGGKRNSGRGFGDNSWPHEYVTCAYNIQYFCLYIKAWNKIWCVLQDATIAILS